MQFRPHPPPLKVFALEPRQTLQPRTSPSRDSSLGKKISWDPLENIYEFSLYFQPRRMQEGNWQLATKTWEISPTLFWNTTKYSLGFRSMLTVTWRWAGFSFFRVTRERPQKSFRLS